MHDSTFAALIYALLISLLALHANRRCMLTEEASGGPLDGHPFSQGLALKEP